MDTKAWLAEVCASPVKLTGFIALVAELESIGSHKIRTSISAHGWGEQEARHLGEESTHALLFKRLLDDREPRLSDAQYESIREVAGRYFQPLDHGTSDHLTTCLGQYEPHVSYVLVSYLIECRALEVYEGVCETCHDGTLLAVMSRVLVDEREHLKTMRQEIEAMFAKGGQHWFREADFFPREAELYQSLQRDFLHVFEG